MQLTKTKAKRLEQHEMRDYVQHYLDEELGRPDAWGKIVDWKERSDGLYAIFLVQEDNHLWAFDVAAADLRNGKALHCEMQNDAIEIESEEEWKGVVVLENIDGFRFKHELED